MVRRMLKFEAMDKQSTIFLLAVVMVANAFINTYDTNAFINKYDEEFFFKCRPNQFVSHVVSIHSNTAEDRRFDMSCTDVLPKSRGTPRCYETGFVNHYDKEVVFQCQGKGYVAGIGSKHSNAQEDRIWRFFCCTMPRTRFEDCKFTEWTNEFDGLQNFRIETGYTLRGMISWHSNHYEDRRFRYEVCRLVKEC